MAGVASVAALATCAPASPRGAGPAPAVPAARGAPPASGPRTITYDVTYDPATMRLTVDARFPPGTGLLAVEPGAESSTAIRRFGAMSLARIA